MYLPLQFEGATYRPDYSWLRTSGKAEIMRHSSRPKCPSIAFSLIGNTSTSPTYVVQGQVTAAQMATMF